MPTVAGFWRDSGYIKPQRSFRWSSSGACAVSVQHCCLLLRLQLAWEVYEIGLTLHGCGGRYLCYLLFQLKTHSSFFSESEGEGEPALSLVAALFALTAITVIVAVCSECAFLPTLACLL